MLFVTTLCTVAALYVGNVGLFMRRNEWLFILSLVVVTASTCAIMCCHRAMRSPCVGYFTLAVYTISHSVLIAYCAANYEPTVVASAAICTMAMFFGLTMYACFSKSNMTYLFGALITTVMMLLMLVIITLFISSSFLYNLIIMLVVVLLSIYVIYDTKAIIGGSKAETYQFSIDDYVMAAMIIYSDVVTIFLYLLILFGKNE